MIKFIVLLLIILELKSALAQVTSADSTRASTVIAKWLSKSTGHYDFLSATTVNPKQKGRRFFGIPNMQMASDYGISYMESPRDQNVTNAYDTIGADTTDMKRALQIPRFHLALGFANKHDFTFSYILPQIDEVKGWGIGYKRVLWQHAHTLFFSYRANYSQSSKAEYFKSTSLMNDLSISIYLRLVDLYAGVRHWTGRVNFESSIPELQLPEVEYFSKASEIERYFGLIAATTTNTRFTLEANTIGRKYAVGAKFSFHFDSIFPTMDNLFRDPRYIQQ